MAPYLVIVGFRLGVQHPFLMGQVVSFGLHITIVRVALALGDVVLYALSRGMVVIGDVLIGIAATHSGFPLAFRVCPAQHAAQGVLVLLVGEVCVVLVVHTQERQSSFVMGIPYGKPHAVSCSVIIENVLQGMDVREVSALVAFLGMVAVDNVPLLVPYVHLLVMVDVAEIVLAGTVHQTGVAAPLRPVVAELQELVVCAVRTYALDILQRITGYVGDKALQLHRTAQSAARKVHAACAVVKGGLVDKIGGNGTEVHRAQHG